MNRLAHPTSRPRYSTILLGSLAALLSILVFMPTVQAQDFEHFRQLDRFRYLPRLPKGNENPPPLPQAESKVKGSTKILVEKLQGLVFVDSSKKIVKGQLKSTGIQIKADGELQLLQSSEFRSAVSDYLGKPVSMYRLNQMVRDIILFYRENDQPVVDVSIPIQDITDGVVQVVITEARVGDVRVEGPCFFDPCVLVQQVCISPGDKIFESDLLDDQRWLLRNPFRSVQLELTPGKNKGETDVVFKVHDQKPVRWYLGYEDTGNRSTGLERTNYGVNWYNAFNRDDQLGYQYTTSSDFKTVRVHSGIYSTALANRDILTFFGSHGAVNVPIGGAFNNHGEFWQTSLRWNRELCPCGCYEHGVQLGVDFKNTNTSLDFGGTLVFANDADIFQIMAGYNGHLTDENGRLEFGVDGYFSPGGVSNKNTQQVYQTINPHADPTYGYARAYLERTYWMPRCLEFVGRVTGQLASTNLLPPETLGFGGFNSIRGYDQYTFAADSGIFANFEIWTESMSVLCCDDLRFLAFYDIGTGWSHTPVTGVPSTADMQSLGLGARYKMAPNVQVRADYGWQLKDPVAGTQPKSRFHIGAVLSY